MDDRMVAQGAPFKAEVEVGKAHWWCSCDRSGAQPFSDGSHKALFA
jgi:CDGSH-type Zn-finger protein